MIKNNSQGKGWRLTKVLYFFITIPFLFAIISLTFNNQEIYRGGSYITDNYLGVLYSLLIILGYILLTELFKSIIFYINQGEFKGFINYKIIFTKYIIVVTVFLLGLIGLLWASNNFRNKGTLEQKIQDLIPQNSILRDLRDIPSQPGLYLGIYIKDYKVDDDSIRQEPYLSCPEEAEGQGIEGEYHIFLYDNGEIIDDIRIEGFNPYQLKFSLFNTKQNNYIFFNGSKPLYEEDGKKIEKTLLLTLKDYNGDGKALEFHLVNGWDSYCGHNNYTIIGYDDINKKLIQYKIEYGNVSLGYRGDNFIPDEKGEVINGWECGDHGADTQKKNYYKFNKNTNIFELKKSEEKKCPE